MNITEEDYYIPKLRKDIKFYNNGIDSNNKNCWVIYDPISDKYFHINSEAYAIIGHLKAGVKISSVLESLNLINIECDYQKLNQIIFFLSKNSLFFNDKLDSDKKYSEELAQSKKGLGMKVLSGYLFLKIELWNPNNFLKKTTKYIDYIFNKKIICFLILLAAFGFLLLIPNYNRLTADIFNSFNATGFLFYFITIIAIKFIHEFSHAYTATHYKTNVKAMGIAFIFFMPRLFVDTTDSWRLCDNRKRMKIAFAGILSEFIIGGIAVILWAYSADGFIKFISYYLFSVSIINTVLFNGNPFMRFDGYYVMSDLCRITNLQQRAFGFLKVFYQEFFFGIKNDSLEKNNLKTKNILFFYGLSTFIYRIFLYSSIIILVYYQFNKYVGTVLAVIEIYLLIFLPIYKEYKSLKMSYSKMNIKKAVLSISIFIIIVFLLFLPINQKVVLEGIVEAEKEIIHTNIDGYINSINPEFYSDKTQKMILAKQINPFLEYNKNEVEVDMKILNEELQQLSSLKERTGQIKLKKEMIKLQQALLNEINIKEKSLKINLAVNGFWFPYAEQEIVLNKWVKKGTAIGEIINAKNKFITAFLTEDNIKKIELNKKISFLFYNEPKQLKGTVSEISYVPQNRLPQTPLQNIYGGKLNGNGSRKNGWDSNEPLFKIKIKLNDSLNKFSIGRTGSIVFMHKISIANKIYKECVNFLRRMFG